MKFNNWLDCVHNADIDNHVHCNSGSSVVPRFSMEVGSNGYPVLKQTGTHDLYAEIQSYKDACDLSTILQNFNLEDMHGLSFSEIEGVINDFTNAPRSPGELLNTVSEGELLFSQLPVGVRSAFGHSLYNFISDIGSPDFSDKIHEAYGVNVSQDNSVSVDTVVDGNVGDSNNNSVASGLSNTDSNDTVVVSNSMVKEVKE